MLTRKNSPDLSMRARDAHLRLATAGYRQGASAGLGLRRMLLDRFGTPKGILERGQRKHVAGDRVILVPGPAEEVEFVRGLFRAAADGEPLHSIAQRLRGLGPDKTFGRQWKAGTLDSILRNPKYAGSSVYNRTSSRPDGPRMQNDVRKWVVKPETFPPVVSAELFDAVQSMLTSRQKRHRTDDELLADLTTLWHEHGKLSFRLIRDARNVACPATYAERFGSIRAAFRRIGYIQA